MRISVFGALFTLLAAAVGHSAVAGPDQPAIVRQWHFAVSLDGKPIGEHIFVVSDRGGDVEVRTRARFKVKALFVSLYSYEHDDREVWRNGCLAQMDAHTRDNGEDLVVHGARSGDNFQVRGPKGATDLPACVKSFAYWDPSFLAEHRLLNAQTGEYQNIAVTDRGRETLQIAGHATDARRYELDGKELTINLWYSPEGKWLRLESQTPKGRKLRYEMQ